MEGGPLLREKQYPCIELTCRVKVFAKKQPDKPQQMVGIANNKSCNTGPKGGVRMVCMTFSIFSIACNFVLIFYRNFHSTSQLKVGVGIKLPFPMEV